MPACYIHNEKTVPREMLEEHHKHPRAYGGPDTQDNLVWLCPSCHAMVHQAANKLYHGKTGFAKDLVSQYIPDSPIRRERLWELVVTVTKARQSHARKINIPEAGEEALLDEEDTVLVSIRVPSWLHHRLKTFSLGTGLEKYILKILYKHCVAKATMPGLEESVIEKQSNSNPILSKPIKLIGPK